MFNSKDVGNEIIFEMIYYLSNSDVDIWCVEFVKWINLRKNA